MHRIGSVTVDSVQLRNAAGRSTKVVEGCVPERSRLASCGVSVDNEDADALPVRTRRSRPAGRHRSQYSMTLPPDPPALILGVPGAPDPATEDLTSAIADEVGQLATGRQRLEVRPTYAEGAREDPEAVMADIGKSGHPEAPDAVVVPLLASPLPQVQDALREDASGAAKSIVVAEPLGPHPLVAGMLHQRLAESGLARSDRTRLLGVSTAADGIIVAAPGGAEAAEAAEVTSVLLASRLTLPGAPAALQGSPGVIDAAAQLQDAGASRLAVAPCLIGPEADRRHVEEAAARVDADSCAPLGPHPDVAKLVMLRYGAALDDALARAERADP